MRTITEKYYAVQEGKFSKSQFLKDAQRELPNLISKFNGFEDSVQILKSKGILAEAKKKEENYGPELANPADAFSAETLERAIDRELEEMGLDSVEAPAQEAYDKAKEKALKNLHKDANHYLNLLSGESKKVDKHDKEVEVKRGAEEKDVFNGMKKADLNEALKDKLKALYNDPEVFGKVVTVDGKKVSLKDFLGLAASGATAGQAKSGAGRTSSVGESATNGLRRKLLSIGSESEVDLYMQSLANDIRLNGKEQYADFTIEDYMEDFQEYIADRSADAYDLNEVKEAVKAVIRKVLAEGQVNELDRETGERIDGLTNLVMLKDLLEKAEEIYKDQIESGDLFHPEEVAEYLGNEIYKRLKPLAPSLDDLGEGKEELQKEEYFGPDGDTIIDIIKDRSNNNDSSEIDEAMEVMEFIGLHYGINFEFGRLGHDL